MNNQPRVFPLYGLESPHQEKKITRYNKIAATLKYVISVLFRAISETLYTDLFSEISLKTLYRAISGAITRYFFFHGPHS